MLVFKISIAEETAYVTSSKLNARSGQGTQHTVKATLKYGDEITVLTWDGGNDNNWAMIKLIDGRIAYVCQDFISKERPSKKRQNTNSSSNDTGRSYTIEYGDYLSNLPDGVKKRFFYGGTINGGDIYKWKDNEDIYLFIYPKGNFEIKSRGGGTLNSLTVSY